MISTCTNDEKSRGCDNNSKLSAFHPIFMGRELSAMRLAVLVQR